MGGQTHAEAEEERTSMGELIGLVPIVRCNISASAADLRRIAASASDEATLRLKLYHGNEEVAFAGEVGGNLIDFSGLTASPPSLPPPSPTQPPLPPSLPPAPPPSFLLDLKKTHRVCLAPLP